MKLHLLSSSIILAALCHLAPCAGADDFTSSLSAGELLRRCRHATGIISEQTGHVSIDGLAQAAYCAGFVEAAADAGSFLGSLDIPIHQSNAERTRVRIRNCAGPAVTGEELLRVVVRFLEQNPGSSEQAAVAASMFAIARAFPCDTPA